MPSVFPVAELATASVAAELAAAQFAGSERASAPRLDRRDGSDRDRHVHRVLASANVVAHGHRPGALEHRGFATHERRGSVPGSSTSPPTPTAGPDRSPSAADSTASCR
ncbi:hypothetical protein [Microbacterium sp. 18062]|uniref:hypothetical protein n=1 Tax=Microbacterium sp. 18062 TaxID=2681410 RepID=UPI001357C2D9|nr:hypothetical protein [Microbacterium sp. 18062]